MFHSFNVEIILLVEYASCFFASCLMLLTFLFICGFDFEKTYGEIGKGFIHVHHIVPVSEIGESYRVDYEKDLIPVCPNCHAMLHRKGGSVEGLKEIINNK